jgi:hypothetical protein
MPKLDKHCVSDRIPTPLCRKHARSAIAREIISKRGLEIIQASLRERGYGLTTYDDILIVPADGCPALEAAEAATETRQ